MDGNMIRNSNIYRTLLTSGCKDDFASMHVSFLRDLI